MKVGAVSSTTPNLKTNQSNTPESKENQSIETDFVGDSTENHPFADILNRVTKRERPTENQENKTDWRDSKEKTERRDSERGNGSNQDLSRDSKDDSAVSEENLSCLIGWRRTTDEVSFTNESLQARAVLHVVDLERIVSTVRTQVLPNQLIVTIDLKRSVLDGLQIKLASDANGRITAELIAGNEKVKAQLDSMTNDLANLLRQRGLSLTKLETSLNSGNSSQDQKRRQFSQGDTKIKPEDKLSRTGIEPVSDESNDIEERVYRA
jgi:hypothetical protein